MNTMLQQLSSYYAMVRNGHFEQVANRPNGFEHIGESFFPDSNIPRGIATDRSWKSLSGVDPRWRRHLPPEYASEEINRLFCQGTLKPIVFTDVDFALIDRDAQGHIDQYVVDRATLESLGFIAQYYDELQNPEIHLSEIKGSASSDRCIEIGQDLFHACLQDLVQNSKALIPVSFATTFAQLTNKKPGELTDEDFKAVLTKVEDAFYELIINPLSNHFSNGGIKHSRDAQAGQNRMKLIYTTIAAFSHSQIQDPKEMLRHRSFSEFNADEHLYPGVRDFLQSASGSGLEVVAITRGNQFPFMQGSGSGIDDLFDRVHSTLIASRRREEGQDPLYPDKKIRSYSLEIDHMATEDKARIMFSETLRMFSRKGVDFSSPEKMLAGIATYLDHCIFITDSDLEAWGTCPTICVLALRSPTYKAIDEMFGDIESISNPIAIINPLDREDPLLGLNSKDVFHSFSPKNPALGKIISDMATGADLQNIYSANAARGIAQ